MKEEEASLLAVADMEMEDERDFFFFFFFFGHSARNVK
jgi:hypothetical protein